MSSGKASGGKEFTTRPAARGALRDGDAGFAAPRIPALQSGGGIRELTLLSDEQFQNELSGMFLGCLGVKPG
jgi:hypothetical protein